MEEESSKAQQEARFKLRESFLNAMRELSGQPCKILTYEKTTLQATFGCWKPDSKEILVQDLKTPANICIPSALLRTPDVLSIQFDNPVLLP